MFYKGGKQMRLNHVIITLIIATTLIIMLFGINSCIQESKEKEIIKHNQMTPVEKCIDVCLDVYEPKAEADCIDKCFEGGGK